MRRLDFEARPHATDPDVSEYASWPVHDEVVLLCPQLVTGGAEALHQLAYAINALGGRAKLAYYGRSRLEFRGRSLTCHHVPEVPVWQAYAGYAPVVLDEIVLGTRTFILVPETDTALALKLTSLPRGIWWLSLDSAIRANPQLMERRYMVQLMGDPTLTHFYQSEHVRRFLVEQGARQMLPLFSYINAQASYEQEHAHGARKTASRAHVAMFPRKGAVLARRFLGAARGLRFALLDELTRTQAVSVLRQCAVYVDFEQTLGKDRLARLAAACGAIVFLHEHGPAVNFADHPLDPYFLFSHADIDNGVLLSRIKAVLAQHESYWSRQRFYRQRIRMGKEEFYLQVRTFFMSNERLPGAGVA
ncbi:hypothetical protein [Paraburkholderia humisilvae]|uniref:Tyrosinase copper-binding domain-containing protein n=1 Tax=Paraburkholderia humisilvae TaxID=627669 RepID=A0A6J5F7Y5_9BURK|nr:hypothetical protein [Paraburkholderia humisilvae]CAB3773246.1 hypothetical protein LMG29542_07157 [Paraburkholderia humisilvae]